MSLKSFNDSKKCITQSVDVCFQENSWADIAFSVKWALRTLSPIVLHSIGSFVLFAIQPTLSVSSSLTVFPRLRHQPLASGNLLLLLKNLFFRSLGYVMILLLPTAI